MNKINKLSLAKYSKIKNGYNLYLLIILSFFSIDLFAQSMTQSPVCLDFGVSVGTDPYMFIDFFKTSGPWTVSKSGPTKGDTLTDRYQIHGLNQFKVVNGSYAAFNYDSNGTCNFISYWDMMVDQGKILKSGYPLSIPTNINPYKHKNVDPNQGLDLSKTITIGSISRSINNIPLGAPQDGWILRWKGKGTFTMDGINNLSISSGTKASRGVSPGGVGNTYAFTSGISGGGKATISYLYFPHEFGRQLRIESSDISDPIRDIQFIYPGMEVIMDGGQNINPKFTEKVGPLKVIRYMDYMNANNLPERPYITDNSPFYYSHYLKDMSWSERTTSDWYRVNATHEYIIEISNLTKTSPWVNIPYAAGKDYVENMARLYMEKLDPDLQLYLEVGNENWNFAWGGYNNDVCRVQPAFNSFHYFLAYTNYFYPGLNDVAGGSGKRISELYKWLTAAAGPSNKDRLVRCVGVQTSYSAVAELAVQTIDKENWDALAITWYYNLTGDTSSKYNPCKSPDNKNWRSWLYDWSLANPNDQPGFNVKFREAVLNEFRCSGSAWIKDQSIRAKAYGKKLVTYEGGSGVIGGGSNGPYGNLIPGEFGFDGSYKYPQYLSDSDWLNALIQADQSSESATIFKEIIDTLRVNGVSFVDHYGLDSRPTSFGDYNLIQSFDMDKDANFARSHYAKYKTFMDLSQSESCKEVLVNLPALSTGAGLAVKLDGGNDYIQADNISYKPDDSGNYTIEGWVQPSLDSTKSYIFSLNNLSNPADFNAVYIREDGKVVWEIKAGNSSVKIIGTALPANKWYHLAATKNGQRYTLYVNGKNVASNDATVSSSNKTQFTLGALVDNRGIVSPFKGQLDEVRVWNIARTEADLRDFMCKKIPSINMPSGLKAYFRFDDGANSLVTANLAEVSKTGSLKNIGFSERSGYTVSGAPIGDISKYIYGSTWSGTSLTLLHSDGDQIGINNIGTGNPDGIHIYFVNEGPYFNTVPFHYEKIGKKKYFGVFAANGTDPSYDLTYLYQGNPDATSSSEEAKFRLLKRNDASITQWFHSGAKLDKVSHTLNLLCREKYRSEYDLGFRPDNGVVRPGSGMALQYNTPDADGNSKARIYNVPDFTDYTITYWAKGYGQVFNLGDRSMMDHDQVGITRVDNAHITLDSRYAADFTQFGNYPPSYGDTLQWFHYAFIRKGTEITYYVNGNIVNQQQLVGKYIYNVVTLLCPPGWMGFQNVAIDEFTLWNTALDQATIKDWMCKKITGKHPYSCKNLLLYFNFDEGKGLTLEDKNGSSDIEMEPGYFNYVVSGAAIGDESTHDYVTPADISFTHPNGDEMDANLKSGTPTGIHLYRVDNQAPLPKTSNDPSILSIDSSRYWGLYVCTPVDVISSYDMTYHYNGNPVIKDETTLRMLDRFDNAAGQWINPTTELVDNLAKTIKISNQHRGEYMLAGTSKGTFEFKLPAAPLFLAETTQLNNKNICGNSAKLIYKLKKDLSIVSYQWIVPEGLNGFSTSDSIVLSATYGGTISKQDTLSVVAINGIGKSTKTNYVITLLPSPTISDAGPDKIMLPPSTSAPMDANTPGANEIGTWSIAKGDGTFGSLSDPQTTVSSLQNGKNIFVWIIKQKTGSCPTSSDSVNITFGPPPIAIMLLDGSALPLYICGSSTLSIKAIPAEGITPSDYIWELPTGMTLISKAGNTAVIQSDKTGMGGTIKVKAVYGNNNSASVAFESSYISIKSQPNKPVFETAPAGLCYNVLTYLSAIPDPTISKYEWTIPFGILPTSYPKSTARDITVRAEQMVEGYITVRSFNDGCSNSDAIDSFYVKVRIAPAKPYVHSLRSDGWAARRCLGEVIYSVENPDPNVEYIWEWEDKAVKLLEYFGTNHSSVAFDMSQAPDATFIKVYAQNKDVNCNASEKFVITSWPPDITEPTYKPDDITIIDPSGQAATNLQIGQIYTLQSGCSTCPTSSYDQGPLFEGNYFWAVPQGVEIIPDNNLFDNSIKIKIDQSFEAPVRVWAITFKGCGGTSDSLVIGTPDAVAMPIYDSGNTTICTGQELNITVKDVGADGYSWQLPDGSPIINTSANVLSTIVNTGMKGNLIVKAHKGTFISEAATIPVFVKSPTLKPLEFYNTNGEKISTLEVCGSDNPYYTVKIGNNFAKRYDWKIAGGVIGFHIRYQTYDKNDNGIIDTVNPVTHDPYPGWEPRMEKNAESMHTTYNDTLEYFDFAGWRLNYGTDGYITVTSKNGCGGTDRQDSIYYSFAKPANQQQPVFKTAPTVVCVGSRITYTIEPIQNAIAYYWNLPAGLSAFELKTSIPQITVDVQNGTGGVMSVYAQSNACGQGTTPLGYTKPISIKGKPVDFKFLDAPLTGCFGETLSYKVTDIGVSKYNWTIPTGLGKDTSGGTSMDFTVKSKESGSVCVSFPTDACPVPYMVCTGNINLTEKLGDLAFSSQINSVCEGKTYRYTATDAGADSYTWILPRGWKISNQAGTVRGLGRSVDITAGPINGTVQIGISGKINCASQQSSTIYTKNIIYNPRCNTKLNTPVFTVQPTTICEGITTVYTVAPVTDAQSYEWVLPAGLAENGTNKTDTVTTTINSISVIGISPGDKGMITVSAKSAMVLPSDKTSTDGSISVVKILSAGLDSTFHICPSLNTIFLFGSISGSPDAGGSWTDVDQSNALNNGNFDPAQVQVGTYRFRYVVSNGNCGKDSSMVTVIVDPSPEFTLLSPAPVCAPGTIDLSIAIQNSVSNAINFSYYSDAAASKKVADAKAVSGGIYYIKGTVGNCSLIKQVEAKVNPKVSAGIALADQTVCSSGNQVQLFSLLSNATEGGIWTETSAILSQGGFNSADGTFAPSGNALGTYKFKYKVEGLFRCAPDSEEVSITIQNTASAGKDSSFAVCQGSDAINLLSYLNGASAGGSWTEISILPSQIGFNAAAGSFMPGSNPEGIYNFKYRISGDCGNHEATLSIRIRLKSVLAVSDPNPVCAPATVDLSKTPGLQSDKVYAYYSDAEGKNTLSNSSAGTAGTYYIQDTSGSCHSEIKAVIVKVNTPVSAGIGSDRSVCMNSTTINLNDLLSQGHTSGGNWNEIPKRSQAGFNTAGSFNPKVNTSGTYTFNYTVNGPAGCPPAQATVNINILPSPYLKVTDPAAVCSPATVDLTDPAVTTGSSSGINLKYFTNIDTTITLSNPRALDKSGTYYIKGTVNGCSQVKPVKVQVATSLALNLELSGEKICYAQDGSIIVHNSQADVSYIPMINNNPTGAALVSTGGDLVISIDKSSLNVNRNTVSVVASSGKCFTQTLEDTATIIMQKKIDKPGKISGPSEICKNDEVVFSAAAEADKKYVWTFPSQAERITFSSKDSLETMLKLHFNDSIHGKNYITLQIQEGTCLSDTSRLEVKMKPNCGEIFIPNIITPNSGDNNNEWTIQGIQNYPNAEIKIMNRWGSLVWQSKGYTKAWHGNSRNNDVLPTGTYYYIIDLQNKSNGQMKNETYNGSVTIMR